MAVLIGLLYDFRQAAAAVSKSTTFSSMDYVALFLPKIYTSAGLCCLRMQKKTKPRHCLTPACVNLFVQTFKLAILFLFLTVLFRTRCTQSLRHCNHISPIEHSSLVYNTSYMFHHVSCIDCHKIHSRYVRAEIVCPNLDK